MEKWDFSITASGFRVIAQKLMFRGFKDGEIVP